MVDTTNPFIDQYGYNPQQDLIEDNIIEAIKFFGLMVKYMPRTLVNEDLLFGEDTLSLFDDALDIEVYPQNVEGFEGEGDLFTRFGVDIRDRITFTISRRRFQQIRTPKIITEDGYNLPLESNIDWMPGAQDSILLETQEYDYSAIQRPQEGDLIYFPMVDKIFEIRHVEHEELFYQFGNLNTYGLSCELFDYSSERFDTGNTAIDIIEDTHTHDILGFQFLLESGNILIKEDDGFLILENQRVEATDQLANNEFIQDSADSGIVDFSEFNPFSEVDRY